MNSNNQLNFNTNNNSNNNNNNNNNQSNLLSALVELLGQNNNGCSVPNLNGPGPVNNPSVTLALLQLVLGSLGSFSANGNNSNQVQNVLAALLQACNNNVNADNGNVSNNNNVRGPNEIMMENLLNSQSSGSSNSNNFNEFNLNSNSLNDYPPLLSLDSYGPPSNFFDPLADLTGSSQAQWNQGNSVDSTSNEILDNHQMVSTTSINSNMLPASPVSLAASSNVSVSTSSASASALSHNGSQLNPHPVNMHVPGNVNNADCVGVDDFIVEIVNPSESALPNLNFQPSSAQTSAPPAPSALLIKASSSSSPQTSQSVFSSNVAVKVESPSSVSNSYNCSSMNGVVTEVSSVNTKAPVKRKRERVEKKKQKYEVPSTSRDQMFRLPESVMQPKTSPLPVNLSLESTSVNNMSRCSSTSSLNTYCDDAIHEDDFDNNSNSNDDEFSRSKSTGQENSSMDPKSRRLARKAELARLSRAKKKMRLDELEAQVASLHEELNSLKKQEKLALLTMEQGASGASIPILPEPDADATSHFITEEINKIVQASNEGAHAQVQSSIEKLNFFHNANLQAGSLTMNHLSNHVRPLLPLDFLQWIMSQGDVNSNLGLDEESVKHSSSVSECNTSVSGSSGSVNLNGNIGGLWENLFIDELKCNNDQIKELRALQTTIRKQGKMVLECEKAFKRMDDLLAAKNENELYQMSSLSSVMNPIQFSHYLSAAQNFAKQTSH